MKSRQYKLIVVVASLLLFVGCIGAASLSVTISPDPITLQYEDMERDVTIKFKTSGMGKLELDKLYVKVYDQEEVVFSEEVQLTDIPFVAFGIGHDETVKLVLPPEYSDLTDFEYEALKGTELRLEVTVTGADTVTAETTIKFE